MGGAARHTGQYNCSPRDLTNVTLPSTEHRQKRLCVLYSVFRYSSCAPCGTEYFVKEGVGGWMAVGQRTGRYIAPRPLVGSVNLFQCFHPTISPCPPCPHTLQRNRLNLTDCGICCPSSIVRLAPFCQPDVGLRPRMLPPNRKPTGSRENARKQPDYQARCFFVELWEESSWLRALDEDVHNKSVESLEASEERQNLTSKL